MSHHVLQELPHRCDALSTKTYVTKAVIPHMGLILTAVTVEQRNLTAQERAYAKEEQSRIGGTARTSSGTSWLYRLARHTGISCMLLQPQASAEKLCNTDTVYSL